MKDMVFESKEELINYVENNTSFTYKEENEGIIIFKDKRGDLKKIEYTVDNDNVKITEDEDILKPLPMVDK